MRFWLSQGELRVFDLILVCLMDNGIAPTFDEIGKGVGVRSKSWIRRQFKRLVHKGYIKRTVVRGRMVSRGYAIFMSEEERLESQLRLGRTLSSSRFNQLQKGGATPFRDIPPCGECR